MMRLNRWVWMTVIIVGVCGGRAVQAHPGHGHDHDHHHPHTHTTATVSSLIGDHMVLQRGVTLPITGTAAPGTRVMVTFNDTERSTAANRHGHWRVRLPEQEAGGPHVLEVRIAGEEPMRFEDILVGDVWVCSGQSNMQWPLARSEDGEAAAAAADHPRIRHFRVVIHPSAERVQSRVGGQWRVCSPQTARSLSAVGYYFGRHLHEELDVPIGLISNAVGGVPAEAFISRRSLENDAALSPVVERYEAAKTNYPQAHAAWLEEMAEWQQAMARRGPDDPPLLRPRPPLGESSPQAPSALYRGMTVPLADLPIKGVIWYQGESNAWRAGTYQKLMTTLIDDWRRLWQQPDMPFLFVQLANFRPEQTNPNEPSGWAALREAQLRTLSVPHTAMAVAIDVGEADDIHPRNKQPVGRRLALAALARVYDRNIVYSGPIYKGMKVEGDAIHLSFDHVGGGLVARGDALRGFAIAGEDRVFHFARATIDGDTIVVKSDQVPNPVAVRYGWASNPPVNLYNQADLPASPFRTDDW